MSSLAEVFPEWVSVWRWARGRGDMRLFPQQALFAGEEPMSYAEYEVLAAEWRAAQQFEDPGADAREPATPLEAETVSALADEGIVLPSWQPVVRSVFEELVAESREETG